MCNLPPSEINTNEKGDFMAKEKKPAHAHREIEFERLHRPIALVEEVGGSAYEIYIVSTGEGIYTLGNRTYPFFSGDVLVIPDGVVHSITAYSECIEGLRLLLPTGYIPEGVRNYFRETLPVIRSERALPELYRLSELIEIEYESERAFREELIKAFCVEFAIKLARAESSYAAEHEASVAVTSTLAYIKEHSSEKISLTSMAAMSKVSIAYLSRRFKAEVGMGFADYLSSFRLQRACTMLKEAPEMSVTEIAFCTGFNDSNYFSDKFKRKFGLSPLKYRNSDEV